MAEGFGGGPLPPDEASPTPNARRSPSKPSPLLLEVRELREELRGSLDRLQEAVLQPLRELREAVDARPPTVWHASAAAGAQAGLGAHAVHNLPALVTETLLDEITPTGRIPDASPWRTNKSHLWEDEGVVDSTLLESNPVLSSERDSVDGGQGDRSRPVSRRSSLASAVAPTLQHLHTAQKSVQNHLYYSQGLDSPVADSARLSARNRPRRFALTVVKKYNNTFELFIGFVILANSICIGVEIELSLSSPDQSELSPVLTNLELVFLSIYIVELILRLLADGGKVFRSPWFLFDLAMVVVGGGSTILNNNFKSGANFEVLEQAPLVRNLRLIRLVRAVRMIELFSDLWKLCMGLMKSARTVASAGMLVAMVAYVFGCVGIELIAKSESLRDDPITGPIVKDYFASVPQVLLTLTQFVNADSIGAIYSPLIRQEPALAIYFVFLIGVVTILLMNLVTAAVVESAIKTGRDDLEMQRNRIMKQVARMAPQVEQAFRAMDITQDGKLDRNELEQLETVSTRLGLPHELRHLLQADKLKDLFDILDSDKDGQVDAGEFVEGMCKIALSSVPVETIQMLSLLRQQQASTQEVRDHVSELQRILKNPPLALAPPWQISRSLSAPPHLKLAPPPGRKDDWQYCPAVPECGREDANDQAAQRETSEGEKEDRWDKHEASAGPHEAGSGIKDRVKNHGVFAGPREASNGIQDHGDSHEVLGGVHEDASRIHEDASRIHEDSPGALDLNGATVSLRICL